MANVAIEASVLRDNMKTLAKVAGDRIEAAAQIGIPVNTLSSRIRSARQLGIAVPSSDMYRKAVAYGKPANDVHKQLKEEVAKRETLERQLVDSRMAHAKRLRAPVRRGRRAGGDTVRVVIPDSHGAHIDKEAEAAFLADLKKINPDEIVMLGDHIDAGGWLAQHHVLGFVAETDVTLEDDVRAANSFLDEIQAAAPRAPIEYIEGNHEQRLEKWCITQSLRSNRDAGFLLSQFSPKVLLRLKDRGIKYYHRSERYDDLPIPGTIKRGKVCFTHEGGGRPELMARKYGANVVHGHTHRDYHAVIRTVGGGVSGCWSVGCLSKLQPLWQATNPTDWTHCYGLEMVAKSGAFVHLNIPLINGVSLLPGMMTR